MPINFDITSMNEFQRDLEEARRALKALDGTLTDLSIDPDNPNDAIRQMELAVDNKVARYRRNPFISDLVKEVKEKFRQDILEVARNGRK